MPWSELIKWWSRCAWGWPFPRLWRVTNFSMSLSQLHQCDGVYRPPRRNLMRAISSDVKRFNNVKLIRLIDKMWLKQFAFVSILEWNSPVLCCYPTGEGTILSIWTTTKDLGKRSRLTLIFGSKFYRSFSVVWWVPWLKKMGGFNLTWFSKLKRLIYRGFTFFGTQILQEHGAHVVTWNELI